MEPPASPDRRRLIGAAIVCSLVLHAIGLIALRYGVARPDAARRSPSSAVDIELAPPPPKAEALPPEQERPATAAIPPAPADEVQLPTPPPVAGIGLDAGIDAAAVAMVDAAPPPDAARIARIDAGVDAEQLAAVADGGAGPADGGVPDDGGALAAGADGGVPDDGGALAAGADGGVPDDGGAVAAAVVGDPGDGGVRDGGLLDGASVATGGADTSGSVNARPSAGTAADLRAFFPTGHVVSVLIRLDRLRDTEWSPQVDAIFKPMPDYRALVGIADVKLADTFDTLAISSPEPRDASATTLVVRARVAAAALRDLLDAPDAPVAWAPVTGGALGRRGRSPRVFAGDRRVFLQWRPGWTTLAQPADLGGLLAPRAGDLDVEAPADARPPWLAQVESIEDESGHPTGPALMATAAGFFPATIPLPIGDAVVPGPDRVTITLELVPAGFLVRGNIRFADEAAATGAAATLQRVRTEVLADRWLKIALGRMGAYNGLKGLSLQRTGRRLAFATSISTADARILLLLVANLVDNYFAAMRDP